MLKIQPFTSIHPDQETVEKIKKAYAPFKMENAGPYDDETYMVELARITLYKPNKKGQISVNFQGPRAIEEATRWDPNAKNQALEPIKTNPPLDVKAIPSKYPQIGSDEVGTGDFFGPICVCAAYIKKEDLPFIKELGVTDSKAMTDEKILKIGPELIKKIPYSQMALKNDLYNKVHETNNMNMIKAKMHNECLYNLVKQYPHAARYQDQFAEKDTYYKYLTNETNVVEGINFQTKAELSFPSVAVASVIARYSFLRKMEKLGEQYGMKFPFGASDAVTEFAKEFVEKFGKEELKKVAKINFANYKKLD